MKKQDISERYEIMKLNNKVVECSSAAKRLMVDYIKSHIFIGEEINLSEYEDDVEPLILMDGHQVGFIIGGRSDVHVDTFNLSEMDYEDVNRVYNTFTDLQQIDGVCEDEDEDEDEDYVAYDEHRIIDTICGEVMLKECYDCDTNESFLCAYIGDNYDDYICEIHGMNINDDEDDLVVEVEKYL